MSGVDDATRDAIMQSPEVQAAMKNAVGNQLQDPAVQQAIKDKAAAMCTPENAALVADKMQEWANDPAVQAKARHYAGLALATAGQFGGNVIGCVEQGPAGVRLLAFGGSVASVAVTVFTLINPLNMFCIITYVICAYMALFALTSALFEASPEWIAKVPGLNKYQDMLIENCKFLTVVAGRGMFYIFQGSLWAGQAEWSEIHELAVGGFLIFVGVLHVAMHFGKLQVVATKMREGYEKASSGGDGGLASSAA